jgi:hypothetical protein
MCEINANIWRRKRNLYEVKHKQNPWISNAWDVLKYKQGAEAEWNF